MRFILRQPQRICTDGCRCRKTLLYRKTSRGVTGSGFWNFGCSENTDQVDIFGSEGKIIFSVFDEKSIRILAQDSLQEEIIRIDNPPHVQMPHVEKLRDALLYNKAHPSTGTNSLQSSGAMEEILRE
jgi:1,5-anhydro-D-fructose reductase (1,5-anhydro-D-mannitol-forming)